MAILGRPSRHLRLVAVSAALVTTLTTMDLAVAQSRGRPAIGATRSCDYRVGRITRSARLGSGEPCPSTLPTRRLVAPGVPSIAQLSGQARRNGRTLCSYNHLGRVFRIDAAGFRDCPLTPNVL